MRRLVALLVLPIAVLTLAGCTQDVQKTKEIRTTSLDKALNSTSGEGGAFISVSAPDANSKTARWVSRDQYLTIFGFQVLRLMEYWGTPTIGCKVVKTIQPGKRPEQWYTEVIFTTP